MVRFPPTYVVAVAIVAPVCSPFALSATAVVSCDVVSNLAATAEVQQQDLDVLSLLPSAA